MNGIACPEGQGVFDFFSVFAKLPKKKKPAATKKPAKSKATKSKAKASTTKAKATGKRKTATAAPTTKAVPYMHCHERIADSADLEVHLANFEDSAILEGPAAVLATAVPGTGPAIGPAAGLRARHSHRWHLSRQY